MRIASIESGVDHTHPDYFPRKNAGERAIIEKWQPGDVIVSDDKFFQNQQANDRFTMRVRPDMTPELWAQMQGSVMTTPEFLNRAVVDKVISLEDHQAVAARFPDKGYLAAEDITHRQQLIADGHDPQDVHKLARSAEHRASQGLGAASMAVNVAEGDYGAAAVDAAGLAVENKGVQELGTKVLVKEGLTDTFQFFAKRAPVIGGLVTAYVVLGESAAYAMDGKYDMAGAALAAGSAEAAGNMIGFGVGDLAREAARGGIIAVAGEEYGAIAKSDIRQIGEGAITVAGNMLEGDKPATTAPEGVALAEVLPASYRSMTQGSDPMGERGEVTRVAIERTGYAANDPRNDAASLSMETNRPTAHLIIQEDGSVQKGSVPFGNNPQVAAGKNGETLAILYAGTGAMNDAQYHTAEQATTWLNTQRAKEGIYTPVEVIAGSTDTAVLNDLPTPRGPLPGSADGPGLVITIHPQQRQPSTGTFGP